MSKLREQALGALDITRWLKMSPRLKETAKVAIARSLEISGLNDVLHRLQVATLGPFIRVVNYHDVPPSLANEFEQQILFLKERFTPIGYEELRAFLDGRLDLEKPGLIVSFDDGLRSQSDVAAPLLEKHGIVGWFFVPTGFVDTPRERHRSFGATNKISWSTKEGDDLGAMSWDDVRRLAERHVVGCHTHSHVRLSSKLDKPRLRDEIIEPKKRLEHELGRPVSTFCWVGGEEWSYSAGAAQAIRQAGYQFAFMNAKSVIRPSTDPLQLHRVALDPSYTLPFVGYRLSGFLDVAYAAQRRRVNRLTAA